MDEQAQDEQAQDVLADAEELPEPPPEPRIDPIAIVGALWGVLSTVAVIYLASHPDVLDQMGYRVRLWWAYRQAPPNVDKLRHMRALRWAGYYDADLVAAPINARGTETEADA